MILYRVLKPSPVNTRPEEKKHFMDYIDQQLSRIELPNKDMPFLREKILLMYANPLTNYLATQTDNPK